MMSLVNKSGLPSAAAARFAGSAAILSAFLLGTGTASAASLKSVTGWQQGTEPSNMSMYIYVPDNVKPNAPILVALHYCGGNASNVFSLASNGGVVSAAGGRACGFGPPRSFPDRPPRGVSCSSFGPGRCVSADSIA